MLHSTRLSRLFRNLGIYTIGVGAAVAGALGLADAIELTFLLSVMLFTVGIVVVIGVHEYLGGPV